MAREKPELAFCADLRNCRLLEQDARVEIHMRKSVTTKALYAGSFGPVTRGHLDIIGKALLTFDTVHVAVGTNVRKVRMFGVEES
jgi:cytidyltransferase-like protein